MQKGLSVHFKDFDRQRLTTVGIKVANSPMGTAYEIPIEYKYPLGDDQKDVQSRLVIECPKFRANKGIKKPMLTDKQKIGEGKPALCSVFDIYNNEDHKLFAGTFGNHRLYEENEDGITELVDPNPKESTGVLASIRDFCVEEYAKYLLKQSKKAKSEPTKQNYIDAEKVIQKKFFYFEREIDNSGDSDRKIEDSKPIKYFKLMTYKPGTQEENSAKAYLPDGNRIDLKELYGITFEYTPFLSFRRIWIGEKVSVTMEVTEFVINDIFDTPLLMTKRASALISRLQEENPNQAEIVAKKYKLMLEGKTKDTGDVSECKITDIQNHQMESLDDMDDDDDIQFSRRPVLPSNLKKTIIE